MQLGFADLLGLVLTLMLALSFPISALSFPISALSFPISALSIGRTTLEIQSNHDCLDNILSVTLLIMCKVLSSSFTGFA